MDPHSVVVAVQVPALAAVTGSAQAGGIGVRAGTTGVGVDLGGDVMPTLGWRLGLSGMNVNTDVDTSQVAYDAEGKVVGKGDVAAQTRQVMENIELGLEAAGATFEDVVKVVNYITDIDEFSKMAAVRREYLKEPHPVSTLVEVSALMEPDLIIEIEAIAIVPEG